MARLESQSKGGFYPTPPEEMNHILKFLKVEGSESEITLIDPCCGEGDALKQISDYLQPIANTTTYGIELEKSRAEKATQKLDYVLNCGYEEVRMSHEAFSVMFLNPPYDITSDGVRLESIFLNDLTKDYLGEGSLLILIIPKYVLKNVAKTLAQRFTNIRVYRFTDANYDVFQQVVVFGQRLRSGLLTKTEREYRDYIETKLIQMAYQLKEEIPTLAEKEENVDYTIKPSKKTLVTFKSTRIDPTKIVESSQKSDHYNKVWSNMRSLEVTSNVRDIRPAMPLKVTHIAAAISAGALPESMGSHLLVGVTKRIQETQEHYDMKKDKLTEVTTFKPKSIVRVFSDKGIFTLK